MGRSSISVRGLAAIATVYALFCVAAASASAAPLVWVSNSDPTESSVSTINGATGKEVGEPIPLDFEPGPIAITPDGGRAVVATTSGQSAAVIDTATRKPFKTIPLGGDGQEVAVSPDGKTAFVTTELSNKLQVVDPDTGTARGTIDVGAETWAVAFDPDGTSAYVGTRNHEILTIDTETEEVVGDAIKVTGTPEQIAFTPDGTTAYVVVEGVSGVVVIDAALDQMVTTIPLPSVPDSVAVSPDGKRLYVSTAGSPTGTLRVVETASDEEVGKPIAVPGRTSEIAVSADGKTAYAASPREVTPINLISRKVEAPIKPADEEAEIFHLAMTPDQSPTAAFTAPNVTAGTPASFSGAASTDPDGSVVSWSWAFGDGGTASGVSTTHTYRAPGSYEAKLSVVDNQGCGEEMVFTGRTAYCSGAAPAVHTVAARSPAPIAPIATPAPSNRITFGRIIHNRRNGTVRLQVKLRSAGFLLLFGPKVHAVTRKSKGVQSMWLTIHARVELAKQLKKTLRAPVRFRVTFTPNGGTPKTVHRSVTLQRTPRHKR
ncbi:MAG: PKD domain-containing protein [Solirubrobacterales bacterium]